MLELDFFNKISIESFIKFNNHLIFDCFFFLNHSFLFIFFRLKVFSI